MNSDAEVDEEISEIPQFLLKVMAALGMQGFTSFSIFFLLQLKELFSIRQAFVAFEDSINIPILSNLKTAENCALQNTSLFLVA